MNATITDKIFEQLMEIRKEGKHNMLDRYGVQREANDKGFYELVIFIEEYPKEYSRFIMTGER